MVVKTCLRDRVNKGEGLAIRRPRDPMRVNALGPLVGCQHPLARAIQRGGQQAVLANGAPHKSDPLAVG